VPASPPSPDAPPLFVIDRPDWLHLAFEPALLFATIGAPPTEVGRELWERTLVAFSWEVVALKGGLEAFQGPLPPLLEQDDDHRRSLRGKALGRMDRALAAAHVAMPHLLDRDTLDSRGPGGRVNRIEQTIAAEARRRRLTYAAGHAMGPARMPADPPDGQDPSKNFLSRVIRPSRSVLHLAAGLALAVDKAEKVVTSVSPTQAQWEAVGFRTAIEDTPEGPRAKPLLPSSFILLQPPIARFAIEWGQVFERRAWAFLQAGRADLAGVSLIRL